LEENKDFLNECMNIINTTIYKVFKIAINDEQEKQILGAYLFGMFNGLGHEKNIKPVDIQGAIIQILNQKLNYSLESAVQFSQFLINSTDKNFHPTMFAIIHRWWKDIPCIKMVKLKNCHEIFMILLKLLKQQPKFELR